MDFFKKVFSDNKSARKHLIALDIGEGFIKSLAIGIDDKNKATVIGAGISAQIPGNYKGGAIQDIDGVIKTARNAIGRACQTTKIDFRKAAIGIGGVNPRIITTNVGYERLKPEKEITEEEFYGIVKKIKEQLESNKTNQKIHDIPDTDSKLLNATIAEIQIDGYKVPTPLGFQGKSINFRLLSVYIPSFYLKIINTILRELQLEIVDVFFVPFVTAKTYSDLKEDFNGIIIDIGNETTSVSVIQGGALYGMESFSIGGANFTRAIARNLNLDFYPAENLKIHYAQHKVAEELEKRINSAIAKDIKIWCKGVELALGQLATAELLPGKIYLTGGGSILPDLANILITGELDKNLPILDKINVVSLNPLAEIGNISSVGIGRSPEYNGAVLIASFSLNSTRSKNGIDKILQEKNL